jgi:hypothetical protein
MILVTEFFAVTLGQAVGALSPSVFIAASLNPFLLVIFSLFLGVTYVPLPPQTRWSAEVILQGAVLLAAWLLEILGESASLVVRSSLTPPHRCMN